MRRALLAPILAAACAALPPARLDPPPLPAPTAAPATPAADPIGGDWYPVDAGSVTLLAGDRNIDVLAGRARLAAAEVGTDQARRAVWPVLAPHLSFFRLDGLTQGTEGEFVDVGKQNLTLAGGVTLSLDVVEARTRLLAARKRESAARHASEAARRAAVLEAQERYDDLVAAQNELAIAREVLAGATAVADFHRARERADAGLRADRLRAEAQEEHARGGVVRAEAGFRDASARLAGVLRIDPRTTLYAPDPALEPLDLVPDGTPLDDLVSEALSQRPEIAEAALLAEAADREKRGLERAPFYPRFVLSGDFGGFGQGFSRLQDREELAIGLVWNLSFERLGRRHEAHAKATSARIEAVRRREAVVQAVVRNHEQVRAAGPAIESARQRVVASEEALRLVTRQHENGTAMLFEVLEQQRDLALARRELLASVLAQRHAERRLHFAIGR